MTKLSVGHIAAPQNTEKGMLNYEEKAQKHQLCEMGIFLYPAILSVLLYFFSDSSGRYNSIQLF